MGRQRNPQRGSRPRMELSVEDRQTIIGGDVKLMVDKAKEIGHALNQRGLKSAQIRNIYGTVRQIHASWPLRASEDEQWQAYRQLQLLKPKIAYQAARNPAVKPLADILVPAIDDVGAERALFQNFVDFFEAILAYHVEAGGR